MWIAYYNINANAFQGIPHDTPSKQIIIVPPTSPILPLVILKYACPKTHPLFTLLSKTTLPSTTTPNSPPQKKLKRVHRKKKDIEHDVYVLTPAIKQNKR